MVYKIDVNIKTNHITHVYAEKESINQSRTKAQVNEMNGFVAMMTALRCVFKPGPLQCHIEQFKRAKKKKTLINKL